jgi:hypothetical protein
MKKPEVFYVRSGYLPLREPRELAQQKGIFSSRGHTMIEELKKSSQEFERRCELASFRLEEERFRRLSPPVKKETFNEEIDNGDKSERLQLLRKILRLERKGAKLDRELMELKREV